MKRMGIWILLLILLCVGCASTPPVSPAPTMAPTHETTQTVSPTSTPSNTTTATATTTATIPVPTSTPTPTPMTTEYKVRMRCREILQEYGATIDGIYAYINNKDPLQRLYYNSADMPKGEIPDADELAWHLLETGKGVCYHFSALTYYLLTEAGYEAILISGLRKTDNAPHRWTMVRTEAGWYHFDPQHRQKLLTDSQKQSASYIGGDAMYWAEDTYPKTPD